MKPLADVFRAALRLGKQSVLGVARWSGVGAAVRESTWRRRRLMILAYHGVSLDDEHGCSNLYVSEEFLERRFSLLNRGGYNVIPLDEAVTQLYEGTLPRKSVVITFDDGSYDFSVKSYPLLKQFGFHATLYLTTYYSQFQRPVFDPVCYYLYWHGQGREIDLGPGFEGVDRLIPTPELERFAVYKQMLVRVREMGLDGQQKDDIARRIAQQVGVDYDQLLERRLLHLMTPSEVRALDPGVVSIELHTHRHRVPDDEASFRCELTDNRRAIESATNDERERKHFCYPSGNYSGHHVRWLQSEGVVSATTCEVDLASVDSHPLLLPRLVDTMDIPDDVFEGWLSGVAGLLPHRRPPIVDV